MSAFHRWSDNAIQFTICPSLRTALQSQQGGVMRPNVTIDPLAPAIAVTKPAIKEVLSLKSGRIFDTRKLIQSQRYEDLIRFRGRILEVMYAGKPRFVCAQCQVAVYLVASPVKAFFFRHRHEHGSCPAITRGQFTEDEIRARKYAGVQESDAHKRSKNLIVRSARADPRFSKPEEEFHWRSATTPGQFRRPDVSALYGNLRIAFEAQLTTTFLSVVVGRRVFYRDEGALLVWVLSRFNPNDRRMTEDDIVFSNNGNVLVVDDETTAASEAAKRFILKCYYRRPAVRGIDGRAIWEVRLVGFDELTLDQAGQRVFLVDVLREEEERRQQAAQAAENAKRQREKDDHALREAFLQFAGHHWSNDEEPGFKNRNLTWARLIDDLGNRGIGMPTQTLGETIGQLVRCLLSAREGAPKGWKFPKLVSVAHHIYEQHPGYIMLFIFALRAYGHVDTVKAEDRQNAWLRKSNQLKIDMRKGNPLYAIDLRHIALVEFLFPEVAALTYGYLNRRHQAA